MNLAVFISLCIAGLAALVPCHAERMPYLPFYDDPFKLEYESGGVFDEFYLLSSAQEAEMKQEWSRAMYLYSELHRLNKSRPEYIYAMARMAFLQNLGDEALRYVEQLPAGYNVRVVNMLKAGSLLNLGRFAEAISFFQLILAEEPYSLAAHRGLAEAMMAERRYEEAAAVFKEMLELDPGALDQHPELKSALMNTGSKGPERWAHILKMYAQTRTVIALFSPVDAATISFHQFDRDKAIEVLLKAIEEDPESAVLNSRLGLFYSYLGKTELARRYMNTAAELAPDNADVINNRGVLAMQLGQDEQAIALFKRAIELKPGYSEALRNLSRMYYVTGKWEEAAYSARQSLIVDQDSQTARLLAGFSYYKLGYYDDALRSIEPLLIEKMNRPSVWFLAGISAHRLGRWTEAEQYYRKGLALKNDYVLGLNNLADLLVSNPRADAVDILEALSLIEKASALTRGKVDKIEETLQHVKARAEAMGIGE